VVAQTGRGAQDRSHSLRRRPGNNVASRRHHHVESRSHLPCHKETQLTMHLQPTTLPLLAASGGNCHTSCLMHSTGAAGFAPSPATSHFELCTAHNARLQVQAQNSLGGFGPGPASPELSLPALGRPDGSSCLHFKLWVCCV
jgi:hypothetical protein